MPPGCTRMRKGDFSCQATAPRQWLLTLKALWIFSRYEYTGQIIVYWQNPHLPKHSPLGNSQIINVILVKERDIRNLKLELRYESILRPLSWYCSYEWRLH
jgi:hypothetical protein